MSRSKSTPRDTDLAKISRQIVLQPLTSSCIRTDPLPYTIRICYEVDAATVAASTSKFMLRLASAGALP